MGKEIVTAETNINEKKTRKQREKKIVLLSPQQVLEMSKQMHLGQVADLVRLLKADVERRSTEIKEILKTTEGL